MTIVRDSTAMRSLPARAIHADLFRDNVMFDAGPQGDELTGFFDFWIDEVYFVRAK